MLSLPGDGGVKERKRHFSPLASNLKRNAAGGSFARCFAKMIRKCHSV